ncbi:MAG: prepilin-type N-terminal cleavage/methylation domain-containing protein [Nitrosomonadales bacterium]|nr:prepilin-type N-terminal cleavage/methylation domain-containing protein [Nitrosomonadales bacterium]
MISPLTPRRDAGFTLVELIVVIVLAGILAAFAVPRFFDRSVFDNRGFQDQVLASLRYAQKAAIAQHRFVCVAFTANSLTFTTGATAACGSALSGPDGQTPYQVTGTAASFSPTPSAFSFDALGKPSFTTTQQLSIAGDATPICVARETGYVYTRPTGWGAC